VRQHRGKKLLIRPHCWRHMSLGPWRTSAVGGVRRKLNHFSPGDIVVFMLLLLPMGALATGFLPSKTALISATDGVSNAVEAGRRTIDRRTCSFARSAANFARA